MIESFLCDVFGVVITVSHCVIEKAVPHGPERGVARRAERRRPDARTDTRICDSNRKAFDCSL